MLQDSLSHRLLKGIKMGSFMHNIVAAVSGLSLVACATAAPDQATNPSAGEGVKSAADLEAISMDKSEGCRQGPMAQFGRYLGDWNIQDWQLSQDGQEWTEQKGARWNFVCVGNGLAIQDFWMPNTGGVGTNLRTYNQETQSWDIVWTAKGSPGLSIITASENENGDMVMHYVSPPQDPPRRITFAAPTKEGWNWKLEMSFDNENSWREVYRIKATKRK